MENVISFVSLCLSSGTDERHYHCSGVKMKLTTHNYWYIIVIPVSPDEQEWTRCESWEEKEQSERENDEEI